MLNLVNQSLTQTPLVGGIQGTRFDDVEAVSNWPALNLIDVNHPIQKIEVRHASVIDALNITYQTIDGRSQVVNHGSQDGGASVVVELSPYEFVLSVYGKAGMNAWYNVSLVNQMTFIIFDAKNGTSRIAGPFGNRNNANEGNVFLAMRPIAFGGCHTTDGEAGIRGLSFFGAIGL